MPIYSMARKNAILEGLRPLFLSMAGAKPEKWLKPEIPGMIACVKA
jgi:hypothetical protein